MLVPQYKHNVSTWINKSSRYLCSGGILKVGWEPLWERGGCSEREWRKRDPRGAKIFIPPPFFFFTGCSTRAQEMHQFFFINFFFFSTPRVEREILGRSVLTPSSSSSPTHACTHEKERVRKTRNFVFFSLSFSLFPRLVSSFLFPLSRCVCGVE